MFCKANEAKIILCEETNGFVLGQNRQYQQHRYYLF